MDSRDITQLRVNRRVEAHKPRDDATLSGKYLSSSAATGRLMVVEEKKTKRRYRQSHKSSDVCQTEMMRLWNSWDNSHTEVSFKPEYISS